ncbi:16S rRNA (uracil1498-N3)-methyltransferase [Malonomonas rubra DSM 5091]|uniref:Ribosomal RNA small subunit methyltransferase E n=1 Tax=Malonomonas rubra DSM 5091 TaxID=1122189 RepID=A0A1M6FGR4_MALRU|nr:16S rRNA (uracil(1498)-N(3))-methyltransferase [Malonomonas rubra]SHI96928.1 16S rRNA (uracil1498-N3)-methyltransferase [Malonomonas rubra DSM 5091]
MQRFFVEDLPGTVQSRVELPEDVLRHLRTVLRISPGTEVDLFDGRGQVARVVIREDFSAEIISRHQCPEPECRLKLIQGLPKGEKLELVLQKGTELGVNHFLPTQMERSVGKLKGEREQKRLTRWRKIVQEAARQSGQPHLPQLQLEQNLLSALHAVDADLKLMLWEESQQPLGQLLTKGLPKSVAVLVGPEGGISKQEAEQARSAGYQAVSLGPRILRTETAGLAIMTILQYLYGDLAKGWGSEGAADQGKDES